MFFPCLNRLPTPSFREISSNLYSCVVTFPLESVCLAQAHYLSAVSQGKVTMLYLSEILLQHHELTSFYELPSLIAERARQGERFFRMDVKPPFPDTPENWEDRLEAAFT